MSTQVHFTHTVPSFCPEIRWSLTSIVYWYWACANYMKWHSKWLNWPITFNDQLYNIIDWQILFTWFWRWLPLRLSKRQSPTTVLFRTTLTQTITQYELKLNIVHFSLASPTLRRLGTSASRISFPALYLTLSVFSSPWTPPPCPPKEDKEILFHFKSDLGQQNSSEFCLPSSACEEIPRQI